MTTARPIGFVEWVEKTARAAPHFKTRPRFAGGRRPWVHLPPGLEEDAARTLAAELGHAAQSGHAIEWVPEGAGSRGHWRALVELADGKVVEVDERATDQAHALERARTLAARARADGITADTAPAPTNLSTWCDRWTAAKRAKGQNASSVISHLRTHVVPHFGADRDPRTISRREVEQLVQKLDALVDAGELRWKSAINVWGTVTKLFDDMVRGKLLELRTRDDNPCRDVRGPDRGVDTEKVHLYPAEFLALAACVDVPLFRRRYYAIAIFNYLRPGELEALRWEDVDLEREAIQIRRAVRRVDDTEKAPKAGRARLPFNLEPALVPLLVAMRAEVGEDAATGRIFGDLGDERELARKLREDLLAAGVERHELHHASIDPPREWMTMHDLRTTGITWMACRGDPPLEIMARAGHANLEQTQEYIDAAALLRRGYGAPFPPLPPSLLGAPRGRSDQSSDRRTARRANHSGNRGGNAWESNPPAAP